MKNVFLIFFQGVAAQPKVERLCLSLQAGLYPCPTEAGERERLLDDVSTRVAELRKVLDKTATRQRNLLSDVYLYGQQWKERTMKEKAIYHTMNLFEYDTGRRCLIAEGWCPTEYLASVEEALTISTVRFVSFSCPYSHFWDRPKQGQQSHPFFRSLVQTKCAQLFKRQTISLPLSKGLSTCTVSLAIRRLIPVYSPSSPSRFCLG